MRNFPGNGNNGLRRDSPTQTMTNLSFAFFLKLDGNQTADDAAFVLGFWDRISVGRGVGLAFQTATNTTIQLVEPGVAWRGAGQSLSTTLHHLAVTRGTGNWSFYVDGVLDEAVTAGPVAPNAGDDVSLMGDAGAATVSVDGSMAEFGLWQAELSAGEVLGLAQGVSPGRVRQTSLLMYVPILGLASPEPDFSGSQRSVTLTGTGTVVDHAVPVGRQAA